MNGWFESGRPQAGPLPGLAGRPAEPLARLPGFILCHGFPVGPLDARQSAGTFPELIDRIANEIGFGRP